MRVMVQTSEELPVVDEHSILSGGRVGGGGGGGSNSASCLMLQKPWCDLGTMKCGLSKQTICHNKVVMTFPVSGSLKKKQSLSFAR